MDKNYLEIIDATFIASKSNKVNNVNLIIKNEGEIISLLGPSGIGKTTMLRTIAGLQNLHSGKIIFKGNVISSKDFNLEPEKRNIALSFQDNSLFPNYNVLDNINFGSKRGKNSKFKYNSDDVISILYLNNILEKFPHQISAGEAQRVSLARSIMSKPDLLLLDEPFSNIDQNLKENLQPKIKKLLKDINLTTIIVTHDSYEAFYMADKCGVILNQSLKQFDVPYNIHHEPNSIEVAKFLNRGVFIKAKVISNDCAVHQLKHEELGLIEGKLTNHFNVGSDVNLLIQPEDLDHDDKSSLKLKIVDKKISRYKLYLHLENKKRRFNPSFCTFTPHSST